MLADRSRVSEGDYFFKVDARGRLLDNGKTLHRSDRSCEYVGVSIIPPRFLPTFLETLDQLIWEERYGMWWEDVIYSLKSKHWISVADVEGRFWGEVDTVLDYQRIAQHFQGVTR
jgi:choline kinase